MTDGSALLRTNNLQKVFGGITAVNDISVHIDSGEILSIIGPNGAGKTTLFNLLTGLYEPTAGTAELNTSEEWKQISGQRPYWIVKQGLARTFQQTRPFGELSVRENVLVALGRDYYESLSMFGRFNQDDRVERVNDLLTQVELQSYADTPGDDLPLALQRRLEIARALALDPQLLLLDEPAAGLNESESEDLLNLLLSLHRNGMTIGLISHTIELVMNVSDRIYVLDKGSVIAEGSPKEIQNDQRVAEAYLGETTND